MQPRAFLPQVLRTTLPHAAVSVVHTHGVGLLALTVSIPRPTARYQNTRFPARSSERTTRFLRSRKTTPAASNAQNRIAMRQESIRADFRPGQSIRNPDSRESRQPGFQETFGGGGRKGSGRERNAIDACTPVSLMVSIAKIGSIAAGLARIVHKPRATNSAV